MSNHTRRKFLSQIAGTAAAGFVSTSLAFGKHLSPQASFFEISLAEWSFHRTLSANKMTNLDFPVVAKKQYGISAVEYVNQFFKDKAKDTNYLNELLKRCSDNGVKNHLIMCDGEGELGDLDNVKRMKDVEKAAVHGLSRLAEYAAKENINIIVENHGGYSSNGEWLTGVMKRIDKP